MPGGEQNRMAMALAAPTVSACCSGLSSSKGAILEVRNKRSRLRGGLWGQKLKTSNINVHTSTQRYTRAPVRSIIEGNRTDMSSSGLTSLGTDEELAQRILSGEFSADDSLDDLYSNIRQTVARAGPAEMSLSLALAQYERSMRIEKAKNLPEGAGKVVKIGQSFCIPLYALSRTYGGIFRLSFGPKDMKGTGERGASTSSSLLGSASSSGRRAFSTSCLFALAVCPLMGKIGDAIAEDMQAKPEKKKGRAPSSPFDEDRLLEQNRRMQKMNNAPTEFPGFVREGFQVKVITSDKYVTSKSGLIYYDMVLGKGDLPQDGQQVIFHYTGYNESGRRVDSSYQQGRPARTRLGIQGMIPGFEEGIKTMRAGGRRIIIVPPELGPPVGPSTFFSAKQFEVFDVELLESKDCSRRTLLFYSDVVCE